MNDDYLWDGSGEPDPAVRRLETLLKRYRQDESQHTVPAELRDPIGGGTGRTTGWFSRFPGRRGGRSGSFRLPAESAAWRRLAAPGLAVAAAVLLGVVGLWTVSRGPAPGWEVVSLEGRPMIGSTSVHERGSLAVGEWVETDAASRAEIRIGMIGTAEIDPNTRVRLVKAALTEHRLALAQGTLHARIWAPPRLFFVETPSAVAVDLGCAYTLSVDDAGASLLRVETGWVAFDLDGRESFVPAGAVCATRPGIGPGTPYFADASSAFREALELLDFGSGGGGDRGLVGKRNGRGASAGPGNKTSALSGGSAGAEGHDSASAKESALSVVLAEARRRDGVTLWHLLERLEGNARARVFDRMVLLVPPPEGVTREGVLAGDETMIDRWWDELGLGVTTWWRLWKSTGPPQAL